MVRRWRVSHPAIVYPVAATVTAKPEAYTNLSYLRSLLSAVQKTGGDPRVYLARTHAACPIVVLLGHPSAEGSSVTRYHRTMKPFLGLGRPPIFGNLQLPKQLILDR
jgi:hypothetical protein